MKDQFILCDQHGSDCPDNVVKFKNGLFYLIAENASYTMVFCPWCGKKVEIEEYIEKKEKIMKYTITFEAEAKTDYEAWSKLTSFVILDSLQGLPDEVPEGIKINVDKTEEHKVEL